VKDPRSASSGTPVGGGGKEGRRNVVQRIFQGKTLLAWGLPWQGGKRRGTNEGKNSEKGRSFILQKLKAGQRFHILRVKGMAAPRERKRREKYQKRRDD